MADATYQKEITVNWGGSDPFGLVNAHRRLVQRHRA
jgi:hypothetical protein